MSADRFKVYPPLPEMQDWFDDPWANGAGTTNSLGVDLSKATEEAPELGGTASPGRVGPIDPSGMCEPPLALPPGSMPDYTLDDLGTKASGTVDVSWFDGQF
jgi:hypothetical protein